MAYIGYNGVKYETGIQIGKGGEGSIFKVLNHPDYILKIYHPAQRTKYKQNKIQAMLSYPITAKLLQVANWPIDIVYDEHGFAGCLLRYYDHIVSLHEILSNSESLSVSDKLLIAKNICYAVSTLHETNLVYGDFNPWNIGINIQSGHVILLDIDSFHLVDEKNEYRCVVGVPEYIAPEVLRKTQNGLTLSSAPLPTFTVESDRFTLAVHIFTLLMNNCILSHVQLIYHNKKNPFLLLNQSIVFLMDSSHLINTNPVYQYLHTHRILHICHVKYNSYSNVRL